MLLLPQPWQTLAGNAPLVLVLLLLLHVTGLVVTRQLQRESPPGEV
jgi:hypothetical protein